jgi:hypothetical protein
MLISSGELEAIKLGRLTRVPRSSIRVFIQRKLDEARQIDDNVRSGRTVGLQSIWAQSKHLNRLHIRRNGESEIAAGHGSARNCPEQRGVDLTLDSVVSTRACRRDAFRSSVL